MEYSEDDIEELVDGWGDVGDEALRKMKDMRLADRRKKRQERVQEREQIEPKEKHPMGTMADAFRHMKRGR